MMNDTFIKQVRAAIDAAADKTIARVRPADAALEEDCIVDGEVDLSGFDCPRTLEIRGFRFRGRVDLSDARFVQSLRIIGCEFKFGLLLRDLRVTGNLRIERCFFADRKWKFLDFRRLRVDGLTEFVNCGSDVGIDLMNLIAGDDLHLGGLQASCALPDADAIPDGLPPSLADHLTSEMIEKAINLEGADIRKRVYLSTTGSRKMELEGMLDLRATVGGGVEFFGVLVKNAGKVAVDMNSADVTGSIFLRPHEGKDGPVRTTIVGQITLRAKVGGQVGFDGVSVMNKGELAVDMSAADVTGSVLFLAHEGKGGSLRTTIVGSVDLRAKVEGVVAFIGVSVMNKGGFAVNMGTAEVTGSIFLHPHEGKDGPLSTTLIGMVDLRAKVGGQVVFAGVSVTSPGIVAVNMRGADVTGSVYLRSGTMIIGNAWLSQATLRGGLSTFSNLNQPTASAKADDPINARIVGDLHLDFATVHGPLRLHAMSLVGKVYARHLTVHGDFSLHGSVVGEGSVDFNEGPPSPKQAMFLSEEVDRRATWRSQQPKADPAIDLELADIQGNLWLQHTKVLGKVNGDEAEIVGEMNMDDCVVEGDLFLRQATIRGRVFANETATNGAYPRVTGKVDLSYADVKQVDVRFRSPDDTEETTTPTPTPTYLNLTGAKVSSLKLAGTLGEPSKDGTTIGTDGLSFETIDCTGIADERTIRSTRRDILRRRLGIAILILSAAFAIRAWAVGAMLMVALATALVLLSRRLNAYVRWKQNQPLPAPLPDDAVKPIEPLTAMVKRHLKAFIQWKPKDHVKEMNELRADNLKKNLLAMLERTYPFSQGFYKRVEAWLRSNGNDVLADEVFLCARKRDNDAPHPLPKRLEKDKEVRAEQDTRGNAARHAGMWLLDFGTGYGVRPMRLATFWLMIGLLNTAIFSSRHSVQRPISYEQGRAELRNNRPILPATMPGKKIVENPWPIDGGRPGKDQWGAGRAFFISLRIQVPFLSMISESDWKPANRRIVRESAAFIPDAISFENYAATLSAMNLLIVPLTIAGLAGLLKRDK